MAIILKPGEKLSAEIIEKLKAANATFNKSNDFREYKQAMRRILDCKDSMFPITEEKKLFLGGFVEGEGSICVGAKKGKNCKFGAYLDPAFNITQHVNGAQHLYNCLTLFGTGRIRHKNGSNATLVFEIDTRRSLQERLVPFYWQYVYPESCPAKKARFEKFCYLLDAFDRKLHLEFQSFVYDLAPVWDEMRMQKGQSNETFKSLEDFQQYCTNFYREKTQNS